MKTTFKLLLVAAFISSSLISCGKKDAPAPAGTEAVKTDDASAKHKEGYQAVVGMFNSGDMSNLGKYIDSSYIDHTPDPGQKAGLPGLVEGMTMFRAGFPDFKMEVLDMVYENNVLAGHVRITGTCANDMMGPGMKGKKINVEGMDLIKFNKDGKAVERWGYWQEKKMMQQLGMLPSDEQMMKDHAPKK
jgi:predicted ester cyclase